jgi:hypothetical protein
MQYLPMQYPITFEFQKTDERSETVTQSATAHAVLRPVKTCAAIVHHMTTDGLPDDAFLYTYRGNDQKLYAT